jgi:hypothetical protein
MYTLAYNINVKGVQIEVTCVGIFDVPHKVFLKRRRAYDHPI